MQVHRFSEIEALNKFLKEYPSSDQGLYVKILFNRKNEEIYYVVEKDKYMREPQEFKKYEKF
jgi:hypothetical protein